jgi:hypothetical protein
MVMDSTPERILEVLGVDDLDIWFPDLAGNLKYRGLLLTDCQDFAHQAGKCFYVVETRPMLEGRDLYKEPVRRFLHAITKRRAILICTLDTKYHAVAFDGHDVLDPMFDKPTALAGYNVQEAWVLGRACGKV